MKKACFFLVICAVILFSFAAYAQELWRGTTYGMSVDQVRATIPGAITPKSKPGTFPTGEVELLRLENVEVVSKRFVARFYFKQKRLCQVTIDNEEIPTSAMLPVFDDLCNALCAKYGRELSRKVDNFGTIATSAKAEWLSGRTNITIFAIGVVGEKSYLSINYQVRLAKEADKL